MSSSGLADRLGGLVMAGFTGTEAASIPDDLVGNLAGIILFKRNLQDAQQVRSLADGIRQRWKDANCEDGPPLIAIDQEGGPVSRLDGIATTTPSAMALGATADPKATEQMHRIIGAELQALGINLDYAPVADVNNNPENPVIGLRSFGEDAHAVAAHVSAAIRGLSAAGVGTTAKHFPGHGDTATDSHFDLPVITHDLDRIRSLELVPFRAAIAGGVDAIMTAHIVFPACGDAATPATLSRPLLTGLLRAELGFEGVICTDCMEMSAIAASCSPARAATLAVASGADLVLFSHEPDKARAALGGLRQALAAGRLQARQIEKSLQRVAALRRQLARRAGDEGARSAQVSQVGSQEHQRAALDIARRAVTLVRDPAGLLPLRVASGQRVFVVSFAAQALTPVENKANKQRTAIGKTFAALGARVHEQTRSLDPSGHEYKQLLMASGAADLIVAATARAAKHPLQARAVADLMMLGKRVVAVATREPYDAASLPADMTVVGSFGDDAHALQAAAEVIAGLTAPRGRLPVTVGASPAIAAPPTAAPVRATPETTL